MLPTEHWETTEQPKSGFRLVLNCFCQFKFSRVLTFTLFSFSAKYAKYRTLRKERALQYSNTHQQQKDDDKCLYLCLISQQLIAGSLKGAVTVVTLNLKAEHRCPEVECGFTFGLTKHLERHCREEHAGKSPVEGSCKSRPIKLD